MRTVFILCVMLLSPLVAMAQDLRVVTVERPPFSMADGDAHSGFSMELWQAIAEDRGWSYRIDRLENFGDMLGAIENSTADVAIANISITADREQVMDFTHAIFESGLHIMVPHATDRSSALETVITREVLEVIAMAFLLLLAGGMLMWLFERKSQPYFDRPAKEAIFPSFWWALNLVVNGGFEERQPRTFLGRIFGVLLVISSLFIVSIFVAHITASMTVEAIQSNVAGVSDLYGKTVGTTRGSTSARYLERREIDYVAVDNLDDLFGEFEQGRLNAMVFDAPILSHYVNTRGAGVGQLVGGTFLRESYGAAMPTGSTLTEEFNRALLRLRENGTYAQIYQKYFRNLN